MKTHHAVAAFLGLVLAIPPAVADDASVDREAVKAQVRHTLSTQGKLSDDEVNDLDKGIDRHAGDHGYGEAISTAVHDALARGCKGTCLADVIHQINGAMDKGATAAQAAREAAKDRAAARGGSDARRDAARERMQDQARDPAHDRAMDRGAAGSPAGSRAMGAGRH